MDWCKARARVRYARVDDIKATKIKEKEKKETQVLCIWRFLQAKI